MAAVVVNGCADYSTTVSSTKLKECDEIEEKQLNGKISHHKNGYLMSSHLANGVSVSRNCFILYTYDKFVFMFVR